MSLSEDYKRVGAIVKEKMCAIKDAYNELLRERDAIEADFAELAARNLGIACAYCSEHFPGYGCAKCEFKWRGYMPNDRQRED